MGNKLIVSMKHNLLATIFEGAKQLYPRENILFLRGKKGRPCKGIVICPSEPTLQRPLDPKALNNAFEKHFVRSAYPSRHHRRSIFL